MDRRAAVERRIRAAGEEVELVVWVESPARFRALRDELTRVRLLYENRPRSAVVRGVLRGRPLSTALYGLGGTIAGFWFGMITAAFFPPVWAPRIVFGAALVGLVLTVVLGARLPSRSERRAVAERTFDTPHVSLGSTAWTAALHGAGQLRVVDRDAWQAADYTAIVVLCASPLEFTTELAGGMPRLHGGQRPAIRWPDGTVEYWWHGVSLPADVAEREWSPQSLLQVHDSEVRRAMVEMVGWREFARRADLRLVARAADPGNPGRELLLYDLPTQPGSAIAGARLLVMTNGSPDRDGHDRIYVERVPAGLTDPVEAAAWQYEVPAEIYRQLERRT